MTRFYSLSENSVDKDPFVQFERWYKKRLLSITIYPDAFSLGTSTADGKVSVRTVLLKDFDNSGFVFFTNYQGRKGKELSRNSHAAMLFYWPESRRQVRIEGHAEKISAEESDEYFNSRPRESRIGAWSSKQSTIIPDKEHLLEKVSYYSEKYKGKEIPRPSHWGGFRIIPEVFEFWQEGKYRLHDRLVYTPGKNGWIIKRLAP